MLNNFKNALRLTLMRYKGDKKILMFNNPKHDKFALWFPVDIDVGEMEIYDVNGNFILRESVSQWIKYKMVDISDFSGRVYFCRMRWVNGRVRSRWLGSKYTPKSHGRRLTISRLGLLLKYKLSGFEKAKRNDTKRTTHYR